MKKFLFSLLLLVGSQSIQAEVLPLVEKLAPFAKDSVERQTPILLMISQDHCAFCVTLREEVLEPMVISGDYTQRAIMGELHMDPGLEMRDWNGKTIENSDFAERYGIWVTPTLLFLDSEGNQLREPMLGVQTVEMYSYYLDEALDEAKVALKQKQRLPQ